MARRTYRLDFFLGMTKPSAFGDDKGPSDSEVPSLHRGQEQPTLSADQRVLGFVCES